MMERAKNGPTEARPAARVSPKVLIVEDETSLAAAVGYALRREGYEVIAAGDGETGLALARRDQPDLILLDVMLPGKNGFDVCKEIRQQGVDSAILMLTARSHVIDRVVGLKVGADDYLSKPFDPAELLARIEALLRRTRHENLPPVARFRFANIEVDFQAGEARKDGQTVPLTAKELLLLRYFIDHRRQVVSREELLQHVWEYQPNVSSRTVDVHMAWLRQKLEENTQNPRYFHTVRGVGYRFTP